MKQKKIINKEKNVNIDNTCVNFNKILVRLSPNASCNKIGDMKIIENENWLQIYVTEKAQDGKANHAMLKLLSKYLKIPFSQLEIVSGLKNRNKIIKIVS